MEGFAEKIKRHALHVATNGAHCATEETTKQALILPLLDVLGFSPYDPLKVRAEHAADLPGIKTGERVDYALYSHGDPVMFIEAKPFSAKLTAHGSQIARYFNATPGVKVAILSNGREWRFFTDLRRPNIMDGEPFYKVDFLNLADTDPEQLARFHYEQFQTDNLRSFAESRVYLAQFRHAIESSLRDVDDEFVRFIAIRANLEAKLTTRFLETVAPIVRQAVAEAVSDMVVTGLTAQPIAPPMVAQAEASLPDNDGDQVDPNNPKIITTAAERKLLATVRDILGGLIDPQDIIGKDTESYYAILYQGKNNRWLLRYDGDRAAPHIWFPCELTEADDAKLQASGMKRGSGNTIRLDKPEHIARLFSYLSAALSWCMDDSNFTKKKGGGNDAPTAAAE